ncbi:hypothetical protein OSB04_023139 [Centaurea solstitialis]|uniref:Vinorine synthase n=1 Tax=Centaurea solstitialis TaxID=347529 RepID=A0AA38T229_9ASTR|nr:hypothetical protein OSB04_023139 [Centaurea solstitialis]
MKVEVISKESVKPSSPTPQHLKTFELSLLDHLILSPYVPIILYYPNRKGDNIFQAQEKSLALKESLSKILTQFYPLARTIKDDLSVDCNDVGAYYALDLVHLRLDEFLSHPDLKLTDRLLPFQLSSEASGIECRDNNETKIDCLVKKVHDGIAKIDYEFVNKAQGDKGYITLQESMKNIREISSKGTHDVFCFTSWCKMGFYDIDFGWGKPCWLTSIISDGCPVFMNLIQLMDTNCGEGIEAWVNLGEEEMRILEGNSELMRFASLNPCPLTKDEVDALNKLQAMNKP